MSLRARSRWAWARASSPVIHLLSPDASAIPPSIDIASFRVTKGRPSRMRVKKPAMLRSASSSIRPGHDLDPRRFQPLDAEAVGARIGIADRDHHLGRAGLGEQGRAGGPAAAVMGAGLERHIDGRAARGLAGLRQRHRLGMRPAAGLGPAAADDHIVLHDHAADMGIGRGPAAAALAERDRRRHPARRRSNPVPAEAVVELLELRAGARARAPRGRRGRAAASP